MATHERHGREQKYHKDTNRSITIQLNSPSANNRSAQQQPQPEQPSETIVANSNSRQSAPNFIASLVGQQNDPRTAPESPVVVPSIDQRHHFIRTPQETSSGADDACRQQSATRSSWFFALQDESRQNPSSSSRLRSNVGDSTVGGSSLSSDDGTDDSPTPPPTYHQIPGIVPSYQGRTSGPPPTYDEVVNPNAAPPSYQSLFGQVREARKTSNGLMDLFRQLFLILIGTLGCTMVIGFLLLIPITMILVGLYYVNDCRAENIPSFLVIGGLVWIAKNILNCYNQFKRDSSTANRPPPRRTPISSQSASVSDHSSSSSSSSPSSTRQSPSSVISISSSSAGGSSRDSAHLTNEPLVPTNGHDRLSPSTANSIATTTSSRTNTSSTATTTTATTTTTTTQGQQIHRIRQPSLVGITSFKCESMLNYFLIVWFMAGCIVVYRIYEPDYVNYGSSNYCNKTVYMYAFWLMTTTFIAIAVILSCLCCLMASSIVSCNHGR